MFSPKEIVDDPSLKGFVSGFNISSLLSTLLEIANIIARGKLDGHPPSSTQRFDVLARTFQPVLVYLQKFIAFPFHLCKLLAEHLTQRNDALNTIAVSLFVRLCFDVVFYPGLSVCWTVNLSGRRRKRPESSRCLLLSTCPTCSNLDLNSKATNFN